MLVCSKYWEKRQLDLPCSPISLLWFDSLLNYSRFRKYAKKFVVFLSVPINLAMTVMQYGYNKVIDFIIDPLGIEHDQLISPYFSLKCSEFWISKPFWRLRHFFKIHHLSKNFVFWKNIKILTIKMKAGKFGNSLGNWA